MTLNKVQFIGNLGADPEIRTTQDGKEIATLSLATSESWKDKTTGEKTEKTEWHQIVIFTPGLVKLAKSYLKKGSKIYLEGQLRHRMWTDKSGIDRYSTEVVLSGFNGLIKMLSSASEGQAPQEQAHAPEPEELNDEIPF